MKSKEEIKKDEEEFYRIQELVLNAKTQEERTKYAWQMYPIIKSAMASALKQRANNHFIYDYEKTKKLILVVKLLFKVDYLSF